MEQLREYVLLPLQRHIFKNFGYYDYNEQTFRFNTTRINEILSGARDAFGMLRDTTAHGSEPVFMTSTESRYQDNTNTSSTSSLPPLQRRLRLVKGEVRSQGLLAFLKRLTRRSLTVQSVDFVFDLLPETATPPPPCKAMAGLAVIGELNNLAAASCPMDAGEPLEQPAMSRCDSLGQDTLDTLAATAPTPELPFRTIGDVVRYIKQQLQGSSVVVEQIHLTLRVPPAGFADCSAANGGPREGTVLLHFDCLDGLCISVDRTNVDGEDFEASLRVGECRVYLHTVAAPSPAASQSEPSRTPSSPPQPQPTIINGERMDLADLVVRAGGAPWVADTAGEAGREAVAHTPYVHHVHISYSLANNCVEGTASPTSPRSSSPSVAVAPTLYTTLHTASWSVVCGAAQIAALRRVVDAVTGDTARAAAATPLEGTVPAQPSTTPATAPLPSTSTLTQMSEAMPGTITEEALTAAMVAAGGELQAARKLVQLSCDAVSITVLRPAITATALDTDRVALRRAWAKALRLPLPGHDMRIKDRALYDNIALPHLTCCVDAVDVLFPHIDVHRAFAQQAQKRAVYRNLFRHALVDAETTTAMGRGGGSSLFIAACSLRVLEHRPDKVPGETTAEAVCVAHSVLSVAQTPYAMVLLARRAPAAASPRAALGDAAHQDVVFVTNGVVQLQFDPGFLVVCAEYGALLRRCGGVRQARGGAVTAPAARAAQDDVEPRRGHLGHRHAKLLVEQVHCELRCPIDDDDGNDEGHAAGGEGRASGVLLRRLLRYVVASSRAHYAAHAADSPLAFAGDRQARFLEDTLCFRVNDMQAIDQGDGATVIRWKRAAVQLENGTTQRVTELARADYTAETAISVSCASPARRQGGTAAPTPLALHVQVCLGEVTTHAIAQDDYLLALYFVRQLHDGLVRARGSSAATDAREVASRARTAPHAAPHAAPLCDEEGDADDDDDAACRHRAVIQGLFHDSAATLTHVSLVVRHARVQLLVPRLSPQGEALGEPMLRCLAPPVCDRDVRRELLFHRYTIDLGGAECGMLLCDVEGKTGAAMEVEARVAEVRLREQIARLPHRAQMALVEEVSIVQSFPVWIADANMGSAEDNLSFSILTTATAPCLHGGGATPACLLQYTSYTRPALGRCGAGEDAGTGQCVELHAPVTATRCVTGARMRVKLCGISVHHLPAHYGDFWAAALHQFFCDAASRSGQNGGVADSDVSRAALDGAAIGKRDDTCDDELRVNVALHEVVWSYGPQGSRRPLLVGLVSHVRGWAEVRDAGAAVVGGGEPCEPVTLYVCDDCAPAELTQEILRGGAGVSGGCQARLEAAGFVRVARLHGDPACESVKLSVRRLSSSSITTLRPPVLRLKVRHLYISAFAARDTVGVVATLLASLVNSDDLRYVELPHVLVMQSSPTYFAAVGDEVVRKCAPMTYRINPALSATPEATTVTMRTVWSASVFSAQPSSYYTLHDRVAQEPQMVDLQRTYERRMRALLARNAWADAGARPRRPSSLPQQGSASTRGALSTPPTVALTQAAADVTGDAYVARASRPAAVVAVTPSDSTSSFESLTDWREAAPVRWTSVASPRCEDRRDDAAAFDLTAACEWAPHFLSGLVRRPRQRGREAADVRPHGRPGRAAPPVLLDLDAQHCGLDVSLYAGRDLDDAATRRRRCGYATLLRTSQSAPQQTRCGDGDKRHSTLTAVRRTDDAAGSRVTLARLYREGKQGQGCGAQREHQQRLVVRLRGLVVRLNGFAAGAEEQRWVRVAVREGTVYDCIDGSAVRKMLVATPTSLTPDSTSMPSTLQMSNFIELTWLTLVPRHVSAVAADARLPVLAALANPEEVVHVRLHPLTLTWTGASLDFLLHFCCPDTAATPPPLVPPAAALQQMSSADEFAVLQPPPMHFRRVVIDPTTITLTGSFESSASLLAALRQGRVTADTLRSVPIISWLTVDHLRLPLRQISINDCPAALLLERIVADSRCLSLRFLLTVCCCVVQPLSAVARVGEAATGLLLVPLAHYRGVAAFHHALATASSLLVQELVTQSAGVAATLTDGTYHATRGLLELLLGTTASTHGAARGRATRRGAAARTRHPGHPPAGLRDGLQRGQEEVVAGVRDAWTMAHYCMRADGSLAQIPAAALRLLMGLSSAATSTLLGVRNAPEAELRRGERDMYKSPRSLDEWES